MPEPADQWARDKHSRASRTNAVDAARRVYDLALTFQERSQHTEARLIEQFETVVQELSPHLGDMMVLDDDDERLWLKRNGRFEAEVVPEREEDDDELIRGQLEAPLLARRHRRVLRPNGHLR